MKSLQICFVSILILSSFILHSQNDSIGMPGDFHNQNGYQSLGKDGLVIFYSMPLEGTFDAKIHFEYYDTAFRRLADTVLIHNKGMDRVMSSYSILDKKLNVLIYDYALLETEESNFKFYSFSISEKKLTMHDGKFTKGFHPDLFFVNSKAGYIRDEEYNWFRLDLDDATISDGGKELNDADEYYSLFASTQFTTSAFVFQNKSNDSKWGFKLLNPDGNSNKIMLINSDAKNSLASLELIQTSNNMTIGVGTYCANISNKEERKFIKIKAEQTDFLASEDGFYITGIKKNQQQYIKFFPMPGIQSVIDSKAIKKEGNTLTKTNVKVHAPVKVGDKIIMVADVYTANYVVITTTSFNSHYGKPLFREEPYNRNSGPVHRDENALNYTRVFKLEKEEYNRSLVMAFDELGNIVWLDSLEIIENQETQNLLQGSCFQKSTDNIGYDMYYFSDGKINCKYISDKGIIASTKTSDRIVIEPMIGKWDKSLTCFQLYDNSFVNLVSKGGSFNKYFLLKKY